MADKLKYSTTQPTLPGLRTDDFVLGTGDGNYGPTSTTSYLNGFTAPEGGYVVYTLGLSNTPIGWVASNDAELIDISRHLGNTTLDIKTAKVYLAGLTDTWVFNSTPNNIVTDSLVFDMDIKNLTSYPDAETNVYDISGEGNDGELLNGVGRNSNGWLNFDRIDDYINLPLSLTSSLDGGTEASLVMILKSTSNNTPVAGSGIIQLSGYNNGNGNLYWYNNGYTYLDIFRTSRVNQVWNNSVIDPRNWHMLTITTTPGTNGWKAYLNGELRHQVDGQSTVSVSNIQGGLTIGRNNVSRYFGGDIALTQIYSKALSQAEVNQNYYGGPIITDGLVWGVDASNLVSYEIGSGTTYALTGSRDGTLLNGVAYSPDNGGTFEFDGIDDYITFGSANQILSDTYFTIECWMKSNDDGAGAGSSAGFVGTRVGKNAMLCRNGLGNRATFYWDTTTEGNINLDSNTVVFDEKWHHIVGTFDNGLGKIYVDGEFKNSASSTAPIDLNTAAFGMGADPNNLSRTFYGKVPIGRVYNRALTDAEVQQNFEAHRSRFGV